MEITTQYIAGFFDGEGSIGIYKNSNNGFGLRTQLTQNKTYTIMPLIEYLKSKFGGNVSMQKTLSDNYKYNWQLNSDSAVIFLEEIFPFLILKKQQASLGILWQKSRPERIRDKNGRIVLKRPADFKMDMKVSKIMKKMKIDRVMEYAKDLVNIEFTLKQIINCKGD